VTAAAAPPTAPRQPVPESSLLRVAAVIGGSVLLLNVAFFILSGLYFTSHVTYIVGKGDQPMFTGEEETHIRVAFALFTALVGGAGIAAAAAPRVVGHAIAMLMGLGSLLAGCIAAMRGMPGALIGAELVLGGLMPYLAFRSWNGSRAAWSFLIAMCSVYAVVLFFGAPTVHRVLDIGLWTTLILPGLNLVAFTALIHIRSNYRE
jgi:hypothetical protein